LRNPIKKSSASRAAQFLIFSLQNNADCQVPGCIHFTFISAFPSINIHQPVVKAERRRDKEGGLK
jgi:hypothetical protein